MKIALECSDPEKRERLTDSEYEFIYRRVPRLCIDLIVVERGKILLALRKIEPFKGCWTFPGGKLGYKETVDEAIARISSEELGVKCGRVELVGYIDSHDDGPYIQSVSLAFRTTTSGKLRANWQAEEFNFWEHIPENTQPYHQDFLKENWSRIVSR